MSGPHPPLGPYPPHQQPPGQFVPVPTQSWPGARSGPGPLPGPGPGPGPFPALGAGPGWQASQLPPTSPPGWGRLVVECSYNPLAMLLAATGPSVVVDGVHRGSAWGRTVLDLPAGQHHLHVHTRYLGQTGKADLPLSVAPGQLVHLYYRAPHTIFSKGRLGPTEQRSGGVGMLVTILASAVLVVLLVLLIALVG